MTPKVFRPNVRTLDELSSALTVSVPDYCALVSVSQNAAHAAIKRGEVPVIRHGRAWRVPAAYVRAVLGVSQPTDTSFGWAVPGAERDRS